MVLSLLRKCASVNESSVIIMKLTTCTLIRKCISSDDQMSDLVVLIYCTREIYCYLQSCIVLPVFITKLILICYCCVLQIKTILHQYAVLKIMHLCYPTTNVNNLYYDCCTLLIVVMLAF